MFDILWFFFFDHFFNEFLSFSFCVGSPQKNISVDCESAISVHAISNMIEAVESRTVNEGKVWNQNMDWLLWDLLFQPILHWVFHQWKSEEDASIDKITSSSSHPTLILLDLFFPPKILSFKGCLFSISWMQYHSWHDFEKHTNKQINRIGKTLKSEPYHRCFWKYQRVKKRQMWVWVALVNTVEKVLPGSSRSQSPICPKLLDP